MTLETKFLPLKLEDLLTCSSQHKADGYRFVQMLCVNTDDGIDLQYSFMKDNVLENYTIPGVKKETIVPSVTGDFIAAFVFENEAHDLFGVKIEGNALDFGGHFYDVSVAEPMTVISPAQKEARLKAAKIAAAKAAKEAAAQKNQEASIEAEREGE
ncbi:MAG: NADH-quinone oxidoreductase subunit C [Raoultibacter sp.]